MYLGRIVEEAAVEELFARPQHPYTRSLLSAIPEPDPDHRFQPVEIIGEIGRLAPDDRGCRFAPRCPLVMDLCRQIDPALEATGSAHLVACHLYSDGAASN